MFTTKGINKHIQSIDFYLTLLVIVCRWRLFQNIISLFHRCNVTSTWQLPEDRQVISHAILLKTNSSIAIAKKVFLCPVLENILKKRKRVIITHLYCIWKQLQASSSLRRVSYTYARTTSVITCHELYECIAILCFQACIKNYREKFFQIQQIKQLPTAICSEYTF